MPRETLEDVSFPLSAFVDREELLLPAALFLIHPGLRSFLFLGPLGTGKRSFARALRPFVDGPYVEVPVGVGPDRLFGAQDLALALRGQNSLRRGLVAEAHGGLLVLRGAEHMDPELLAALLVVHEMRENRLEREGWSHQEAADFRLLAVVDTPEERELPEGAGFQEFPKWRFPGQGDRPARSVAEGLRSFAGGFALSVWFAPLRSASSRAEAALRALAFQSAPTEFIRRFVAREETLRAQLTEARVRLSQIEVPPGAVRAAAELVRRAAAEGNRVEVELVFAAQALAAWEGRSRVEPEDVRRAAPWVLAHRSRRLETLEEFASSSGKEKEHDTPSPAPSEARESFDGGGTPAEVREGDFSPEGSHDLTPVAAGFPSVQGDPSKIPSETEGPSPPPEPGSERPAHLAELPRENPAVRRNAPRASLAAGRGPAGGLGAGTGKALRPALWTPEVRIHWEGTIRRAAVRAAQEGRPGLLLPFHREDLVGRFVRGHRGTLLVLAVDLSGSMGGRRLALAQRAALAFLAEAYVRRDRVAIIGFRGKAAEVLLPPTHSPERAHDLLQGVRTGGCTPLAQGIWAAAELLRRELRRRPDLLGWFVLLTDGRANVSFPPREGRALGKEAYPFTAIVGQETMKTTLLLGILDLNLGGVLIRGEKGTAKSTAVRALAELLPEIRMVADCPYACDPDDLAAMCPSCKRRKEAGEELPVLVRKMRVVDLPLSTTEDRLVGTLDVEAALRGGEVRFRPGLLAAANRGILYVDEVNLLDDHLVDLLLDAAAMGENVVEREGLSVRHPARFLLVGTMNPEEGELRPQLLDRFGLCVEVEALADVEERAEVVRRRLRYEEDPEAFRAAYAEAESELRLHVVEAQRRIPRVSLPVLLVRRVAELTLALGIDGHRADLAVLRAARAHAAFFGREEVGEADVAAVAYVALCHRMRRRPFEDREEGRRKILTALWEAGFTAPELADRFA